MTDAMTVYRLRPSEYRVYKALEAAFPNDVSMHELVELTEVTADNSVRVTVHELRRVLGVDAIATVTGYGYRLMRKVNVERRAFVPRSTHYEFIGEEASS